MMSPALVVPNTPESAQQAEKLVSQTAPIKFSNEPTANRSPIAAQVVQGDVGEENSVSRRRPASSVLTAPAAQRLRFDEDLDLGVAEPDVEEPKLEDGANDDRRGVTLPHIARHRITPVGRIEFLIQIDQNPAHDKWLLEHEIKDPLVHYDLQDYRVKVSGVKYHGRGGTFKISEVLDHRFDDDGRVVYFVSWAGKWSDPVWRSEPIDPQDNARRAYERYNRLHDLPPLPRQNED